jgi:hypothetical protein
LPLLENERHEAERYGCCKAILVQLNVTTKPTDLAARACDLSATGVGLNLPYRLEVGSAVVLLLRGRRTATWMTMSARVAHATEHEGGAWRVGCAFERRLESETLEALL